MRLTSTLVDDKKETTEVEDTTEQSADSILDDLLETRDLESTQAVVYGKTKEEMEKDKQIEEKRKALRFGPITEEDKRMAVRLALVPAAYVDAKFDEEKVIESVAKQYEKQNKLYLTFDFDDYIGICQRILTTIRMGKLPERSYIIGAPNSFGKTSFVTECIITLNKNDYMTAPYISLYELAELRKENTNKLMIPYSYKARRDEILEKRRKQLMEDLQRIDPSAKVRISSDYAVEPRNYESKNSSLISSKINVYENEEKEAKNKAPMTMEQRRELPKISPTCGQFSYTEYINAECLFVALSGGGNKEVESYELRQLLAIRGMKGLPTIVTVETSLDLYRRDTILAEQVWDDIEAVDENSNLYDRLYHVSTYKAKVLRLNIDSKSIDTRTGIVR